MKKAYRVKKNEEFQQIFKHGHSFANRQLVLYFMKKEDQAHYRVGFSVGKKIGNAVMRNQIKRYLRQAFTELEAYIEPEYDYVVIARNPTKQMDFHEVKDSLLHVIKKSKKFRQ
ncbi:ribonuclease P protein component [Halalkalibacillus halophilus]|uniref:ribonuclease P protein component n=1 Tax=Halalkalibacillus halophilus TaxID=392827 RepID=UPI0004842CA0|nr:ribonuclease P protein component [Halalkalibacillus halophilus]